MSDSLHEEQAAFLDLYENWLSEYLKQERGHKLGVNSLLESMAYSLQLPGKRFRPFLSYLVWKIFKKNYQESIHQLKNWCLAVEFIHTYSLIHDDLPCMDDDDFRRGKPSNHKVFGEDIALLAGDGLLTEAFNLIATDQNLTAEVRLKLVSLLSEKIGTRGMVAGQVLDMNATPNITTEELKKIHLYKTGYLIEVAALGGAVIGEAQESELEFISEYSKALGLAFQIKDDLMDVNDNEQDHKSYVAIHGIEKTKDLLQQISNQALQALNRKNNSNLIALVQQNISRET